VRLFLKTRIIFHGLKAKDFNVLGETWCLKLFHERNTQLHAAQMFGVNLSRCLRRVFVINPLKDMA